MAEEQYDIYYEQLQNYLKSSEDDRENLMGLLKRGHHVVMSHCGVFTLDNTVGLDLVFDWVRFTYNGFSEHFFDSFLYQLNGFRMQLWMDGDVDVEET